MEKENVALRKILRDIEGVNGKRSSKSMRDAVIKRNFERKINATDVYSTSNSFSVTAETKGFVKEDVNKCDGKSSFIEPPITKKSKHNGFSRKKSNLRKLQFDSQIDNLRKTVESCYTAMQPVQYYTHMRLKYYASISDSNCLGGNNLNHIPRKRKRSIKKESDEEVSDEKKESDLEDSSDEDVVKCAWTYEVDGIKVVFKRINQDNIL